MNQWSVGISSEDIYMLRYVRTYVDLVWFGSYSMFKIFIDEHKERGKNNLKKRSKEEKSAFSTKIAEPNQWKRSMFFFKKANLKVFGELIIMGKRKRTTKRLSNCQNFGP